MEPKLYLSAAYYPELWPLEQIDTDLRLMREAGLNAVRMTEFAWSRMEPAEGAYDFEWLEIVLDKLHTAGMGAILGTPTPTPPAWLTEKHPEMLFINREGRQMTHGARRHYCYNAPVYREHSARITRELARRLGQHPAVIGWQTDNEFFCHVQACYCPTCKTKFHAWLKARYGTIDQLNHAWGTHIWSEYYNHFSQIPLPVPTAAEHNPSLETAFLEFASESMVDFQEHQLEIIREYSDQPITHNGMPPFHRLDYDKLFENLDFASMDFYLPDQEWWRAFYEFDWMRRKCDAPFWMLETDPGWNGGKENSIGTAQPGFIKMKGLATYGFGGQGHSYWVWRQQRTGCEMLWGSLIYTWGQPTPRFGEVQEIAKACADVGEFLFAAPVPQAELAVHYSNRSHILTAVEPMSAGYHYFQNWFEDVYRPVLASGVFRDVIFESSAVDDYKVIFTAFMPIVDDALLAKMQAFVENGGTWIIGPMTGYRTADHTVPTEAALGALEKFIGVPVTHFFPMVNQNQKIRLNTGKIVQGKYWGLSFRELNGAQSLGRYPDGPAGEQHFGFEKTIGSGKIILCGAALAADDQLDFIRGLLKRQRLNFDYEVTWGTTVAPRTGKNRRGLVVVNWNGAGGRVMLPQPGVDLVSRAEVSVEMVIAPFEVAFIEFR